MTKYNAENERIKRKYYTFLKEAKQHSEPTIEQIKHVPDTMLTDSEIARRNRALMPLFC